MVWFVADVWKCPSVQVWGSRTANRHQTRVGNKAYTMSEDALTVQLYWTSITIEDAELRWFSCCEYTVNVEILLRVSPGEFSSVWILQRVTPPKQVILSNFVLMQTKWVVNVRRRACS